MLNNFDFIFNEIRIKWLEYLARPSPLVLLKKIKKQSSYQKNRKKSGSSRRENQNSGVST